MPKTTQIESTPSLRAAALAPLLRHFQQIGKEIDGVLARHGVSSVAVRDSYDIIPLQAFLDIFEDAAELAADPVLGAKLGRALNPASLGPSSLLVLQSGTIRAGLRRFHKGLSALQSATEMRLIEHDDQARFTYQIRSHRIVPRPQDAEFTLSHMSHLIRVAFDPRWRPLEVHFKHSVPKRPDLLQRIFQAPVRFSQNSNCLIFSQDGLDVVHRSEDKALIAVLERHLADLVLGQDVSATWIERVQGLIAQNLGVRPVNLGTISEALSLTPRSLQRHLAGEGTSLRSLLKDHRQALVAANLQKQGRNLEALAHTLGYADSTVLWRAHKGWTGEAPSKANR